METITETTIAQDAPRTRAPRKPRHSAMQLFLRMIREADSEGVCLHTDQEIFTAATAAFPQNTKMKPSYVGWYRNWLRSVKGEVPPARKGPAAKVTLVEVPVEVPVEAPVEAPKKRKKSKA